MNNYPDNTWEGDPRAPWNQPEPWEGRRCHECKFFCWGDEKHNQWPDLCLCEAMNGGFACVEVADYERSACECFEYRL